MQPVIGEEKLHFKVGCSKDTALLSQLGKITFVETYGEANSKENVDKYIRDAFSKKSMEEQLEDNSNFFLIVSVEKQPVGYAKLRENNQPFHDKSINAVELERIYVKQEFQGNGIGAALIDKCLAFARLRQYPVMWLGVWEQNHTAIQFYQTQGFEIFGSHGFQLGDDLQNDYLLKKNVN